jgi:hypothetical protein
LLFVTARALPLGAAAVTLAGLGAWWWSTRKGKHLHRRAIARAVGAIALFALAAVFVMFLSDGTSNLRLENGEFSLEGGARSATFALLNGARPIALLVAAVLGAGLIASGAHALRLERGHR